MKRAVRTLIRIVAAGFLVFGVMGLGLEFMRRRMHKGDLSVWHCILGGILMVLGVFLFLASDSLAEQLTDDPEE